MKNFLIPARFFSIKTIGEGFLMTPEPEEKLDSEHTILSYYTTLNPKYPISDRGLAKILKISEDEVHNNEVWQQQHSNGSITIEQSVEFAKVEATGVSKSPKEQAEYLDSLLQNIRSVDIAIVLNGLELKVDAEIISLQEIGASLNINPRNMGPFRREYTSEIYTDTSTEVPLIKAGVRGLIYLVVDKFQKTPNMRSRNATRKRLRSIYEHNPNLFGLSSLLLDIYNIKPKYALAVLAKEERLWPFNDENKEIFIYHPGRDTEFSAQLDSRKVKKGALICHPGIDINQIGVVEGGKYDDSSRELKSIDIRFNGDVKPFGVNLERRKYKQGIWAHPAKLPEPPQNLYTFMKTLMPLRE